MELLKSLLTLWVWKETRQAWTMFSKLKALVGLEEFWVIIFSVEFSLPSMVSYVKVKFQVIVFMYRTKIDNSELSLPSNSMYHRKIQTYKYRFCPELLLWKDTQSFDIWGISPRLEVLPLTQKYQTQQKDLIQQCHMMPPCVKCCD